jgi:hypothetical protein
MTSSSSVAERVEKLRDHSLRNNLHVAGWVVQVIEEKLVEKLSPIDSNIQRVLEEAGNELLQDLSSLLPSKKSSKRMRNEEDSNTATKTKKKSKQQLPVASEEISAASEDAKGPEPEPPIKKTSTKTKKASSEDAKGPVAVADVLLKVELQEPSHDENDRVVKFVVNSLHKKAAVEIVHKGATSLMMPYEFAQVPKNQWRKALRTKNNGELLSDWMENHNIERVTLTVDVKELCNNKPPRKPKQPEERKENPKQPEEPEERKETPKQPEEPEERKETPKQPEEPEERKKNRYPKQPEEPEERKENPKHPKQPEERKEKPKQPKESKKPNTLKMDTFTPRPKDPVIYSPNGKGGDKLTQQQ